MTPQARRMVLALLAVLGFAWVRRRPVRGPEATGDWQPADG